MEKQVSILLVGIGGYGEVYVRSLLDHAEDGRFAVKGIIFQGSIRPFPL